MRRGRLYLRGAEPASSETFFELRCGLPRGCLPLPSTLRRAIWITKSLESIRRIATHLGLPRGLQTLQPGAGTKRFRLLDRAFRAAPTARHLLPTHTERRGRGRDPRVVRAADVEGGGLHRCVRGERGSCGRGVLRSDAARSSAALAGPMKPPRAAAVLRSSWVQNSRPPSRVKVIAKIIFSSSCRCPCASARARRNHAQFTNCTQTIVAAQGERSCSLTGSMVTPGDCAPPGPRERGKAWAKRHTGCVCSGPALREERCARWQDSSPRDFASSSTAA